LTAAGDRQRDNHLLVGHHQQPPPRPAYCFERLDADQPPAIGKRVVALSTVIHSSAVSWCQLEDLALPAWRRRALPAIGSDEWDTQLAAELIYCDEPSDGDDVE